MLVHTAPYAPLLCHSVMQYAGRDGKVSCSLNGHEVERRRPITKCLGFRPTFVINGLWSSSTSSEGEYGGNFYSSICLIKHYFIQKRINCLFTTVELLVISIFWVLCQVYQRRAYSFQCYRRHLLRSKNRPVSSRSAADYPYNQ